MMDDARPNTSHAHPAPQASDKKTIKDPNPRPKVNKRTKTGCLTCRRRRIKCDEGRPICNKCTKSKRHCDGYNQKVTFKHPYSSFPATAHGPAIYPPGSSLAAAHPAGLGSSPQGALQAIAPKPPSYLGHLHRQLQHPQQPPPQVIQSPYSHPPPHRPQGRPDYLTLVQPFTPVRQEPLLQQSINNSPTYYVDFVSGLAHHHPQPNLPGFSPTNSQAYSLAEDHRQNQSSDSYGIEFRTAPDRYFEASRDSSPPAYFSRGIDQAYAHNSPLAAVSNQGRFTNGFVRASDGTSTAQLHADDDDDVDDMAESDDDEPHVEDMGQLLFMQQLPLLKGLEDLELRALFNHFTHVTGPCISMYERLVFKEAATEQLCPPMHVSGPSTWNCTFPLLSLGHPALLHAILAMAGLQMGNMGRVKFEVGYKQYSVAIRRLRRNASSTMRIAQPATLAAALLLAYFDVWRADHKEWCRHIFGARTIVNILGLKEMSRRCLSAKLIRQRQKEAATGVSVESFLPTGTPNVEQAGAGQYIDFRLLRTISGLPITPEEYGVGLQQVPHESVYFVSEKEIQTYETFRDLFWWYCKMDVYQSILGATKLFMRFKEWTACPPRAPVSRIDAIYGTYDHLILLLGRVADFAARDLPRKREVYKQRMGQGKRASPPFMGMLPAAPDQIWRTETPHARASQDGRVEDAAPAMTEAEALRQWEAIHRAFDVFRQSLGPEFLALDEQQGETENRLHPFGAPLRYRSYAIAGIWMNYHMGKIHLDRCHPDRPPAMMHAARDAAKQTSHDAKRIGRIATGLAEDCSIVSAADVPICAALIESAFCLFVAGIQYRKKAQREWLLERMHHITRITGWQSAAQIASGCESAWLTSFLTGDGPVHNPSGSGRAAANAWETPRRLDQAIREARDQEPRRLGAPIHLVPNVQVPVDHADRAHYALGILGMESDLDNLFIQDD